MMIKKGDSVRFPNGEIRKVTGVDVELDDTIAWLEYNKPNDPSWVALSELEYIPESQLWVFNG